MTLVGGSGTLLGPIIGTTFLIVLKEWLRFLREYYMILYGVGIVFVMIFMPYGIMGLAKRVSSQLKS
jgi:branched-chain amino acid transport system permease protein